jgi:AcrR family transcriptional regulator
VNVARTVPPGRFDDLIETSARVFTERGYKRTQMSDIADSLGVAKGTVYLYVESKEALFDLTCRLADTPRPRPMPAELPVRAPPAGATTQYVAEQLATSRVLPFVATLLAKKRRGDARSEVEEIVSVLFDDLRCHRGALKLIDQSARDLPDLAALWFEGARGGLLELLTSYLEDRIRAQKLQPVPHTAAAARLIIETTTFWAVHRHWDAHPQEIDEATAKQTVVHFVVGALVEGGKS